MATLGWIKFGVACDTTQFAKSTQQAAAETQRFGDQLRHMASAYLGFEALKMGTERVREWVGSAMEGVAQSTTLAERVGMSSTAFQQMSYSAKLAHVDQDGLAIAVEQMNKRLGEVAVEGAGPAAEALARFGLTANGLVQAGPEQALKTLLGVIGAIRNPMERAAVAQDVFGKSGQQLINVALKGGDALKVEGKQALAWGTALAGLDNTKIEDANQSLIKLQAAGQGFANLVVARLSPYIVALTEKYLEWGYSGTKSADFVKRGMDLVVSGVGLVGDGIASADGMWHSMQATSINTFGAVVGAVDIGVKGLEWFANAGLTAFRSLVGFAADGVGAVGNLFKGMFEGLNAGWNMLVDSFASGLDFILRPLRDLSKKLGLATTDIDQDVKGLRDLPKALDFSGVFDGMSKGIKGSIGGGKVELTDFFGEWSRGINELGDDQAKAAEAAFAHIGEGSAKLRGMMADVEKGAQDRAAGELKKSDMFHAPGADLHKPIEKPAFAGATELGSKEAYSTIVRGAAGHNEIGQQRRVAAATERTAAGVAKLVELIGRGVGAKDGTDKLALMPSNPAAF